MRISTHLTSQVLRRLKQWTSGQRADGDRLELGTSANPGIYGRSAVAALPQDDGLRALADTPERVAIVKQLQDAGLGRAAFETIQAVAHDTSHATQHIAFNYGEDIEFSPPPPPVNERRVAQAYVELRDKMQHAPGVPAENVDAAAARALDLVARHLHHEPQATAAFATLLGWCGQPDTCAGILHTRFGNLPAADKPAAAQVLVERLQAAAKPPADSDIDHECAMLDFLDAGRRPHENFAAYHRDAHRLLHQLMGDGPIYRVAGPDNVLLVAMQSREPGETPAEGVEKFEAFARRLDMQGIPKYTGLYGSAAAWDRASYEKATGETTTRGVLTHVADTLTELVGQHGVHPTAAIDVLQQAVEDWGDKPLRERCAELAGDLPRATGRLQALGLPQEHVRELVAMVGNSTYELVGAGESPGFVKLVDATADVAERLVKEFQIPPKVVAPIIGEAVFERSGMEAITVDEPAWLPGLSQKLHGEKHAETFTEAAMRMAVLYHYAMAMERGKPDDVPPAIARKAEDWQLLGDYDSTNQLQQRIHDAVAAGSFATMSEPDVWSEMQTHVRLGRLMGKTQDEAVDAAMRTIQRQSLPNQAGIERDEDVVRVGGISIPIRRTRTS